MIKSAKDLGLTGEEELSELDSIFQEKLNISFANMRALLRESLHDRASEIAAEFLVMTPYNNYDKLLEEQPHIANFLRNEASKDDNWEPNYIGLSRDPKMPDMLEVLFNNKAVDGGDALFGYIFLNYEGKVLHVFVQADP